MSENLDNAGTPSSDPDLPVGISYERRGQVVIITIDRPERIQHARSASGP